MTLLLLLIHLRCKSCLDLHLYDVIYMYYACYEQCESSVSDAVHDAARTSSYLCSCMSVIIHIAAAGMHRPDGGGIDQLAKLAVSWTP